MTSLPAVSVVFAMAQPGQSAQSPWASLSLFAVMVLIFYAIVLLPMRRRQRKVQEFQGALKVGDRVVLTSGIYGQVTRLAEATVQVQIAEQPAKVRVEVARAAVGGYQGQEPVVQPDAGRL